MEEFLYVLIYCVDLKAASISWQLFSTNATKGDFTAHYWLLAFRKKRPQDSPNWKNWTQMFPRKYCSPVIFGEPPLFKLYLFEKQRNSCRFLRKNFGGGGERQRYNAFINFPYFQSRRVMCPTKVRKCEK